MKLSKFDLESKMSILDMKQIKVGCGTCSTGHASCSSSNNDFDNSTGDSDHG